MAWSFRVLILQEKTLFHQARAKIASTFRVLSMPRKAKPQWCGKRKFLGGAETIGTLEKYLNSIKKWTLPNY